MPSVDIPMGSEFSPAVIGDFPKLLGLVYDHQPDRRALQAAIDTTFFPHQHGTDLRKTLGDNTILSMSKYGLITISPDAYELTDLGKRLVLLRSAPEEADKVFAEHVLINCQGLILVECIRDLMSAGVPLTKRTIAKELSKRGLHMSTNAKHLNVLRQWLERFGVLNEKRSYSTLWEPSEKGIERIMGLTVHDLDALADLTPEQRDFAQALALLDEDNTPSNKVREHATALYGTEFPEGGLPQSVLIPLEAAGLLTWVKTTNGRGAKPHDVSPTEKLRNALLIPAMEAVRTSIGTNYKKLVRMRYEDILLGLDSSNIHEKGIALEALAVYLCRILDLTFVRWRHRSNTTGGTEVDVLVEGSRLLFSRWQIQCKNTTSADVDQLAKEVGIATAMRTNVVMFVCNGRIGSSVRQFARTVMENTAMQIILLDKSNLEQLRTSPADISSMLTEQAHEAMLIKRIQVDAIRNK